MQQSTNATGDAQPAVLKECPEHKAGIFSKLTFGWMTGIMNAGYKSWLQMDDIWDLPKYNKAADISTNFQKEWQQELKEPTPSLLRTIRRVHGRKFLLAGIMKLFYDCMQLTAPLFIQLIVNFLQDTGEDATMPWWQGYLYCVLLLVLQVGSLLLVNQYFHRVMAIGLQLKAGLITATYQKSTKLSNAARQQMATGEIINMMSIDTQRFQDLTTYLHLAWSGVFQILVCLGILFWLIGWATFAGFGVMILLIPINGFLARFFAKMRRLIIQHTGERIKLINEILQGMRVIKFYAWEKPFLSKIMNVRTLEINAVRRMTGWRALNTTIMSVSPILVSVTTFIVYALTHGELNAATIFTSLAYFNLLRFPLNFFPMILSGLVEARVSLQRLQKFLTASEIQEREIGEDYNTPIRVVNGEFVWDSEPSSLSAEQNVQQKKSELKKKTKGNRYGKIVDEEEPAAEAEASGASENQPTGSSSISQPTLTNISFEVPRGTLTCVVGAVGAGKSSLLSGILGEMKQTKGTTLLSGTIAYCPQQAWIQNATLKDNILFGFPLDESRYENTVRICALEKDIEILHAGDMTEIGEKGINLSGGQRQRVSLARAVYFNADIYLLDDPLSAVDSHVGRYLFEECINGALNQKTRILVTHQWQYLRYADQVLFMKDGKIVEKGTYDELMRNAGDFAELMNTHMATDENDQEQKQESDAQPDTNIEQDVAEVAVDGKIDESATDGAANAKEAKTKDAAVAAKPKTAAKGALISDEERTMGTVGKSVIIAYAKACGGVVPLTTLAIIFLLTQSAVVGNNWWLAYWSSNSDHPIGFYIGIYVGFAGASAVFQFTRDILFQFVGLRAAFTLFEGALKRVLRSPMSFFDSTPVGRIINRFSKDQETIDLSLAASLQMFLNVLFNVLSTFVVIAYVTPYFLIPLLPTMYVYYRVQQYYRATSREVKRLESIARSPLFAHFSETLGGLSTIRAYNQGLQFSKANEDKLDTTNRAYFVQVSSQRWLSVRLEAIGTLIVLCASAFAVLSKGTVESALAGLSLTYALQVTGVLNWTVRQATESETHMNAVERVVHYTTELSMEAEPIVVGNRPPATWPSNGDIVIENLVMRYRADLEPVLRGISAHIQGGEKIGIVGRTGAGKSSLMVALFRLVELAEGKITIDGVDISKIGLEDLRSKVSIIPQDPVLFSGTIRSNLDPFGIYNDSELWQALERAHLKPAIEKLEAKLSAPVIEYGENFSVGQRQLICLARAILRRSKVLVMDEATASVDIETDALIQRTVRSEFASCTMLTIAHRLNTIIDSDKIMVLDQGKVVEYDTPANLLRDENSMLSSMVAETGPANARALKRIALGESGALSSSTSLSESPNQFE